MFFYACLPTVALRPAGTAYQMAHVATHLIRQPIYSAVTTDADQRALYAIVNLPGGYALHTPLVVTVERDEEGLFVASVEDLQAFGVGSTQPDAASDFGASLVERYVLLVDDEPSLVAGLHSELADLRRLIVAP